MTFMQERLRTKDIEFSHASVQSAMPFVNTNRRKFTVLLL